MTDADLDAHITRREVIDAFNQMGREWNAALGALHEAVNALEERLRSVEQAGTTAP